MRNRYLRVVSEAKKQVGLLVYAPIFTLSKQAFNESLDICNRS